MGATVDGLSAIRELKAHGVEVYFDLEELHSFQPDFELQYSIRAAIAQGEREDFHDSIVLAMGYRSNNPLEEQLKPLVPQVIVIGEARQAPGNSMIATGDALNAALAI